ncbi:hypothetical protein P7K49_032151 [Saguinus oedipus]|uniref:Uncharacterized protein n=1 Tax=Saguinus oedipus TaxID=9490 RepID=A0ABQ9TYD0_SAGOE|nr:hypothetical protein P7K49_032151 [Saguinus oedipus]
MSADENQLDKAHKDKLQEQRALLAVVDGALTSGHNFELCSLEAALSVTQRGCGP